VYINKLEGILTKGDSRLEELKAYFFLITYKFKKAEKAFKNLLKTNPKNSYLEGYAQSLMGTKNWLEAKQIYEKLISYNKNDTYYLWNKRYCTEKSRPAVNTVFNYIHAPESLRHIEISSQYKYKIKNIELAYSVIRQIHIKKSRSGNNSIREPISGYSLSLKADLSPYWQIGTEIKNLYFNRKTYWPINLTVGFNNGRFSSLNEFTYGKIVTDPIEGLNLEAKIDTFSSVNSLKLFKDISLGYSFKSEWYRVDKSRNVVNGKEDLGYKIFHNFNLDLPLLKNNPYVVLENRFTLSHWDKTAEENNTVLDFIEDERIQSHGIYVEYKIKNISLNASISRNYDYKRKFYYTISNIAVNIWLKEYCKLYAVYEYGYETDSVAGSGNIQNLKIGINVLF